MPTTHQRIVPRSDDIRNEAIQILINGFGLAKTAFFIRDNLSRQGDYLAMKDELFGDKTAAEIYNDIKNRS